ncbi:ABC transporter substrate-binding protein [Celeribacter neptunius]|uniref:NitT/TauT family transport system substrate-binding protein n=1 Tax=Celeribacter neptunius TaxID=588602 RepID=A0A1I3Y3B8_9RHOB|nr:ABC transporter substrate-binding protein [Celeribacter neptunius]SFK26364.1 NitT/TauT family transport system substrate-binding protein [Celeribacter neptunius]
MKKSYISRRGFMASTAGLAASGLVLGAPSIARAAAPIRIGVGSDPVFAGYFIAQHEGFFEEEGVAVNLQPYSGGGEAMNALVAGQVDLASASESTTMVRMDRAEIRPLAVVYDSGLYVKLVLRPGLEDPKDIKTFGIVPGSISEYCTGLTIAHFDLDATSLKMVPSGPPELPALLIRGDIDAFFAWEPWPATALGQGAKVALTSRDVGYTDTIWANASQAILDSNPEGLQAMLRAVKRGSDIMQNDPERGAEGVKAVTRIPIETTLKVSKDMFLTVRDFTDKDFESFDGIAQFLVDNKVTETPVPYRDYMQRGFYKG